MPGQCEHLTHILPSQVCYSTESGVQHRVPGGVRGGPHLPYRPVTSPTTTQTHYCASLRVWKELFTSGRYADPSLAKKMLPMANST